jgi:transcriptional regulator with XRE-family HTH domain
MTEQTASGNIPSLTLGWRLKMSLDYADISVHAMAEMLGVSRATLSRWMSDKGERPKKAYLSQWALATGVPFEWIDTGVVTAIPSPDGGGTRATRRYPELPYGKYLRLPPDHDLTTSTKVSRRVPTLQRKQSEPSARRRAA